MMFLPGDEGTGCLMHFCAIYRIGRNKTPIETGADCIGRCLPIPLLVRSCWLSFCGGLLALISRSYALVASAHKHKCLYVISIVLFFSSLWSSYIPASKLRMQRIGTAPVQMFFMLLKPLSSVHQGYRYVGETSVALTYYLYRLLII